MSALQPRGAAGVLALDHIAFGVRSIAGVASVVASRLGGVPYQSGPGIGFRGAQWTLGGGGRLEAIEPDGGSAGFLDRFLEARGPGVHHVTFKVADIDAAAAAVRAAGLTVVGLNTEFGSWKEMFLHPREAQGIVVQLAESHPEIGDDGWTSEWPYPQAAAAEAAATVCGLRLRALSMKRACVQWETLLGAERRELDGAQVFEWLGSPLRLSVAVDASGAEGPEALEMLSDRDGNRGEQRIRELGCSVLRVAR